MIAELIRDKFYDQRTLGKFQLCEDGGRIVFSCFTCEDTVRPAGVKIPGVTAIPEGDFWISITDSVRLGRPMPIIFNTPELDVIDHKGNKWSGVRQHSGNTEKDTEGCILMGNARSGSGISESRVCMEEYMKILEPVVKQSGRITFKIINSQVNNK